MRFALCFWTAAMIASAGPLTIQTQEVIWTNGFDTLRLGPATVDGTSGGIVLGTYELTVTNVANRFVEFSFTQDAVIGDSRLPFSMLYGGFYQLSSDGTIAINLASLDTVAPFSIDGNDDPAGRFVIIHGVLGPPYIGPPPAHSTVSAFVRVVTPEPLSFVMTALGITTLLLVRRARRR